MAATAEHDLALLFAKAAEAEGIVISWPDAEPEPDNFGLLGPEGELTHVVRVEVW